MNSITTSNQPVLKIEGLNLVFSLDIHRSGTLRDSFVKWTSHPLQSFIRTRDRLQVAKNLNFEIYRGERVGLLGVNGAGKTSLCRCIAGMYRPTSGKIQVSGAVRAIFDRQVGILPELTGRENAKLLVHFLFPNETDTDNIVEEALEFSELKTFIDVPFRLYSNGMQARLCLSLLSARPAELLILDEVFDGADTFFKEKISVRFFKTIQNSGAVLFVSHAADQIRQICTRLIVLHQGEKVFDGDPHEGLEFYKNLSPQKGTC